MSSDPLDALFDDGDARPRSRVERYMDRPKRHAAPARKPAGDPLDVLLTGEYAEQPEPKPLDPGPAAKPDKPAGEGKFFDVDAAIKQTATTPVQSKPLPGDTPRMAAPGAPVRREIALDSSRASAEHAETEAERATRNYNGLLAGSQAAVPFFPRIRGAVAGAAAEQGAAWRALTGQERENTEFARMQAAYEERKNAQRQIEGAEAAAPVPAAIGNVLTTAAMPIGSAKTVGGRIASAAGLGAASGASAADRFGVTNDELLAGGAVGAGIGAAAGALGEGARHIVATAPAREDKAFIREIVRTEGGEGSNAMLAKNKVSLAKDYEAIIAQRKDPEIRKAVQTVEGKGIPIINKKIEPHAEQNAGLYGQLDKAAVATKANPKAPGQMTSDRLMDALEQAKGNVGAEAAVRIDGIIGDLREHVVPRVWKGEQVIPASRLRQWLTSVQDSAGRVPGSLNATQAYASTMEAQREATRVVNDYFDRIGRPDVMEKIRSNNAKMVPLIRIRDALETKAGKEKLEHMGLSKVMEEQTRKLELGAAAGMAASGHLGTAAAIVARPYAEKGLTLGARNVNRRLLEPLQLSAQSGNPYAKEVLHLITTGIPLGTALRLARSTEVSAAKATTGSDESEQLKLGPAFLEGQP
jgi:hypothetical protein